MGIRDQILTADDRPIREFECEWGTIYLREFNLETRLQAGEIADSDPAAFSPWLLVASVCEKNGAMAFTVEDVELLQDKSGAVVQDVVVEILRINRLSDTAIEETEENSEAEEMFATL